MFDIYNKLNVSKDEISIVVTGNFIDIEHEEKPVIVTYVGNDQYYSGVSTRCDVCMSEMSYKDDTIIYYFGVDHSDYLKLCSHSDYLKLCLDCLHHNYFMGLIWDYFHVNVAEFHRIVVDFFNKFKIYELSVE